MSVTFPFCQTQISSRLAEFQLRQIGHTSKQFHSSHSSICFKKSAPLSTTAHSTAFRTLHQPTASVISSISWVHGCCWGQGNCPRAHNLFWSEVRRSAAGVKLVRLPLFFCLPTRFSAAIDPRECRDWPRPVVDQVGGFLFSTLFHSFI